MVRILHIADVHLNASFSSFGALAEARRDEQLARFQDLPRAARQEKIDAVVVAGDLFDGPGTPAHIGAAVREVFRRIDEAGIPVFVVPGNHDALFIPGSPYRDGMGAAHLFRDPAFGTPVRVEGDGAPLFVYGLAHDPARVPDPLGTFRRAEAEGVHLVLLHGSVPDAPHWKGSPNALSLPQEALAAIDADYLALGDYHRFRGPDAFDGAPACYAGSFAALDLTETGARGYLMVDLAPGEPPAIRHLDAGVTPVFDVGTVDVSGCADDLAVAARVADSTPDGAIPVVRLVGEPAFPLDIGLVETELCARFGHAGVRDESRFFSSARIEELAEGDTVVGHTVRLGRARIAETAGEVERRAAEQALRIAVRALQVR